MCNTEAAGFEATNELSNPDRLCAERYQLVPHSGRNVVVVEVEASARNTGTLGKLVEFVE